MFKCFTVETVQTAKVGAYPQFLVVVYVHANYHIVAKAVNIIGIMEVCFKSSLFTIKIYQAPAISTNPYISRIVFGEIINIAKTQTHRVGNRIR